jgi:hypothetical protein
MTKFICNQCLYSGSHKLLRRGSRKLNRICWMIFPFGLPYNIWRMVTKKKVCNHCESEHLIDIDTELGQRLLDRFVREGVGGDAGGISALERIKNKAITALKDPPLILPKAVEPPVSTRRDPSEAYIDKGDW